MTRGCKILGIGLAGSMAAILTVFAVASVNAQPTSMGHSMVTGSVTSQPIGHYDFCKSHRSDCRRLDHETPLSRLTAHGWTVLRDINSTVNYTIMPQTDFEIYGKEEVWSYPQVSGDCEDYALLKRQKLIENGFSPSDLLLTVVRKPDGEGHAVLTVRTSEGDYILDNLDDEIRLWDDTPYRYLKRQATFHSGRWVTIENGNEVMVGSVK